MNLSGSFAHKLMSTMFRDVTSNGWFRTFFNYCVDSKYRVYKRLDAYLKEQLLSTDASVVSKLFKEAGKIKTCSHPDKQVVEVLRYVFNNYKYVSDSVNYGVVEKWASASEIISKGGDDCDGLNSLVYVLCRIKGVPEFLLWNCIGSVGGGSGGHYWLVYLSPVTGDLYPIDATYWVSVMDIPSRGVFRFSDKKYQSIWYCFNEDFIFKPK